MLSPQRQRETIDALRRGTVPQKGLDAFAVGMNRFQEALDRDLGEAAAGGSGFKAVRGEYGSGKTFFARWLQDRAKQKGFAATEVQISETETPLHRLETVYRRLMENLSTRDTDKGAFRSIIDGWFYALEEDVLAEGKFSAGDADMLLVRSDELMEQRLAGITRIAPGFSAALRGYRKASAAGDNSVADGLLAWLTGQPNVGANVKRAAGLKGDIDHFGALSFLQGLLVVLRDSGHSGLVLVLDEVETLQRVRGDVREKALNALRQLIDEIDAGRFPGLYLIVTGTPSFYDGPQGIQRLPPLAQRLHIDLGTDSRFDNARAVQVRLHGFNIVSLKEVGIKVRDIYMACCDHPDRILSRADDSYIEQLALAVTGRLGGRVGIAPRIFLKKLIGDVLDRIDLHDDFNPRVHYSLTLQNSELTEVERNALGASTVDDIELQL
jgi:hypothetical protein